MPLRLLAFVGAVFGAGLLALPLRWPTGPALEAIPWSALALFAGLTLVAEQFAGDIAGRSRTSVSTVPMLAASFLFGAPGSIATVATFALWAKVRAGSPLHRMLFNLGMALLGTECASWTLRLLGPSQLGRDSFELALLGGVAAGLVYYLVNHLLMSLVRGLAERRSPWRIWVEQYRWLWPHYAVLGGLAIVVAYGYQAFGATGVLALMAPVGMMQLAIRQYVDQTASSIRQLEALNADLQGEIAQRRAAEEENARLAREAARVAALEELSRLKSEFISIASHELRTPLTGILGFSELLTNNDPLLPEDDRRRFQRLIFQQAEQLAALVDNLLDVSRIESGRVTLDPIALDLEDALWPILESARQSAPGHTLSVDLPAEARWVRADPDKVRQILTNLVSNAVKYSPAGGGVTISAQSEPGANRVTISVADQGLGIPPDQIERIFDRFQRVDAPATRGIRGTGLGLFIVRELVELHGGTIGVESTVGRGSAFHFTLPAAPAPTTAASRAAQPEAVGA
ncbi:MAG TPA: HAMP domain-containing sensor histidine kinase [Chloroflexota bacterium]